MIRSWRHKDLKELFETGGSAKVRSDQHRRCLRIPDALNVTESPGDMNVPGWNFHALQGKPKRWAVAVNGPGLWLRMQIAYDLWHAERAIGDSLAKIPSHEAA